MKPDDEHCLVTRSNCYLQLGNSQAALTEAEAALYIYIERSHMYVNKSITHMFITHVNHTFMLLQALEMKPDDEHCLVTRSKCYLQLGNSQAALTDAEAALEINPKLIKVSNHICHKNSKNLIIINFYL